MDTFNERASDFVGLYRAVFADEEATQRFVDAAEAVPRTVSLAKIVMHQGARMVCLADFMGALYRGSPALQIFFLVVAAEAIAKMADGFTEDGKSKHYVRGFFRDFCDQGHQHRLETSFRTRVDDYSLRWLSLIEAVDVLYDVRCLIAHEGEFFVFQLCREMECPMMTACGEDIYEANLTYPELRQIVLQGAVNATNLMLSRLA